MDLLLDSELLHFKLRSESGPTLRLRVITFQTPFREWTYSQTQRCYISNSVQRVDLLSDSEFLHFKLRSESGPTLRLRVITFQTPFREWTYSQTQSFYISNSVQRVDLLSDSEFLHFKLRSESGPTLRLRVFTFQTPFREWTYSQTQSFYISNSVQRVDLLSDSEFLHFKLRSESGPTLRLRVHTTETDLPPSLCLSLVFLHAAHFSLPGICLALSFSEVRTEMFYLTTHSTHFIYGYMASHIWLRTILIVRKETRCRHIGYSFRLAARVILYASFHTHDNTYHDLCYTSRGTLARTRYSSMGPP